MYLNNYMPFNGNCDHLLAAATLSTNVLPKFQNFLSHQTATSTTTLPNQQQFVFSPTAPTASVAFPHATAIADQSHGQYQMANMHFKLQSSPTNYLNFMNAANKATTTTTTTTTGNAYYALNNPSTTSHNHNLQLKQTIPQAQLVQQQLPVRSNSNQSSSSSSTSPLTNASSSHSSSSTSPSSVLTQKIVHTKPQQSHVQQHHLVARNASLNSLQASTPYLSLQTIPTNFATQSHLSRKLDTIETQYDDKFGLNGSKENVTFVNGNANTGTNHPLLVSTNCAKTNALYNPFATTYFPTSASNTTLAFNSSPSNFSNEPKKQLGSTNGSNLHDAYLMSTAGPTLFNSTTTTLLPTITAPYHGSTIASSMRKPFGHFHQQQLGISSNLVANGKIAKRKRRYKKPIGMRKVLPKNSLMLLHELRPNVEYRFVCQSGPIHIPLFTLCVDVDEHKFEGIGKTKKEARIMASQRAVEFLLAHPEYIQKQQKATTNNKTSSDETKANVSDTASEKMSEESGDNETNGDDYDDEEDDDHDDHDDNDDDDADDNEDNQPDNNNSPEGNIHERFSQRVESESKTNDSMSSISTSIDNRREANNTISVSKTDQQSVSSEIKIENT